MRRSALKRVDGDAALHAVVLTDIEQPLGGFAGRAAGRCVLAQQQPRPFELVTRFDRLARRGFRHDLPVLIEYLRQRPGARLDEMFQGDAADLICQRAPARIGGNGLPGERRLEQMHMRI